MKLLPVYNKMIFFWIKECLLQSVSFLIRFANKSNQILVDSAPKLLNLTEYLPLGDTNQQPVINR